MNQPVVSIFSTPRIYSKIYMQIHTHLHTPYQYICNKHKHPYRLMVLRFSRSLSISIILPRFFITLSFSLFCSILWQKHDIYSLCLKLKLPRASETYYHGEQRAFFRLRWWTCRRSHTQSERERERDAHPIFGVLETQMRLVKTWVEKLLHLEYANFSIQFWHEIQTKIVIQKIGYGFQYLFISQSVILWVNSVQKILQPNKINWKLQFIHFVLTKKKKYFHNFICLD